MAEIVGIIQSQYLATFTTNPIYAIIIILVGLVIGWFLHYQVFGF